MTTDMRSKFSRFKSHCANTCGGCGCSLDRGDTVYGTKDLALSPKGDWLILCPGCYEALDTVTDKIAKPGIPGVPVEFHLLETKPSETIKALESKPPTESESAELLREFIEAAEQDQIKARKREERRAERLEKEREERKNTPWTLEWLWEHAEWRWSGEEG